MLFVLSYKSWTVVWNVVKSWMWWARPLLRAQQFYDPSPILSVVSRGLYSQQAHSQGLIQASQKQSQRPVLLSLFWSLNKTTAAKSLQSCPNLCYSIDGSPAGSRVPGILQARTLEWVTVSFSNAWKWKVKGKPLSHVRFLVTPWTAAYQAPPSMRFSDYCLALLLWNNAICSNMVRPRDCQVIKRKTNIIWYHLDGESKM